MAINKVVITNDDGTSTTLVDLTEDTVTASNLLNGITAHGADGEQITGTIPTSATYRVNLTSLLRPVGGAMSPQTNSINRYIGDFTLLDLSFPSSAIGTANIENVLDGYTFYNTSLSNKYTGTMTNNGAVSQTIAPGASYTIPAGYHNGSGTVSASAIPSEYIIPTGTINITSNGTVDVSNYATASVNVSGGGGDNLIVVTDETDSGGGIIKHITMSASGTVSLQSKTITPTTSLQTITGDTGYTGLDTVTVNPIPSDYIVTTDATATAADIATGKTAYVNGSKITGTAAMNVQVAAGVNRVATTTYTAVSGQSLTVAVTGTYDVY